MVIEHYRKLCSVAVLQMEKMSRFGDLLLSIDPEILSWLRSSKIKEGVINAKISVTNQLDWKSALHVLRCTMLRFLDSRDPELFTELLRLRGLITLCEALSD